MQFETNTSLLRRNGSLQYSALEEFAFYSASLEPLALQLKSSQIDLCGGDVKMLRTFNWFSLSMASHEPLVFLGLSRIGRSTLYFRYGCPWTYKASLLRAVLVRFRRDLPVTRQQVVEIYAKELAETGFPGARLWASLAGFLLPRKGWHRLT